MSAPTPPDGRWVRAEDLAQRTPFSARTIRRWCATGHLPASRRGGLRVWWVDLETLKARREGGSEHLVTTEYDPFAEDDEAA